MFNEKQNQNQLHLVIGQSNNYFLALVSEQSFEKFSN